MLILGGHRYNRSNLHTIQTAQFNYNNIIDYKNDSHVSIENMNFKCNICHSLKWSKEPPDLCHSGGKVLLAEIADSPEPLKSF